MVKWPLALFTIAALASPDPSIRGPGGGDGPDAASLKLVVPQKWEYLLPNETPLAFGADEKGNNLIPIAHAGGEGFRVEADGAALAVDTNGDGKTDQRIKGLFGSVVLKGTSKDGAPLSYGVRILMHNGKWHYLPGSAMAGKLLGRDVKLVDLNGNGRYDEFGVDAMIFGRSPTAGSYLSKVVSAGGKLYEITVSADGSEITPVPFQGETGTLNLASGFKVDGALASAVVLDEKNGWSFEVSGEKSGLVVPVGRYQFMSGFVRNGAEQAKIRGGNSKPIAVLANQLTKVTWGTPLEIEFDYRVSKDQLTVPIDIKFFGSIGEEYYDFKPEALSPRIVVYDKKTRTKLTEGRFGGC
jgi:hypothetical protein